MADIRRSVKTSFWSDEWVESLKVDERYFFLYLLTNDKTKISGFYETTLKRMAFETGLTEQRIAEILLEFDSVNKVYFESGYIQILNFVKNQELNPNMEKSILKALEVLPNTLKGFQRLLKSSKGFERLRKKEREKEKEREIEKEKESQDVSQTSACSDQTGGRAVTLSEIEHFMEDELKQILVNRGMSIEDAENDERFNFVFDNKSEKYFALCKSKSIRNPQAYISTLIQSDFNEFIGR